MWRKYPAKSAGRVIQFIYRYCGLHLAERVQVGDSQVTYNGRLFAKFTWKDNRPVFEFVDDLYNKLQNEKAEMLTENGGLKDGDY